MAKVIAADEGETLLTDDLRLFTDALVEAGWRPSNDAQHRYVRHIWERLNRERRAPSVDPPTITDTIALWMIDWLRDGARRYGR